MATAVQFLLNSKKVGPRVPFDAAGRAVYIPTALPAGVYLLEAWRFDTDADGKWTKTAAAEPRRLRIAHHVTEE